MFVLLGHLKGVFGRQPDELVGPTFVGPSFHHTVSNIGLACYDLVAIQGMKRVFLPLMPQISHLAEKDWTEEDRGREKVLMQELVTLIEQRNAIVNCLDEDRQR